MLTGVDVVRRVQLADACRHLKWNGDRLVLACDDGALMVSEHPSGFLYQLSHLGSAPTTLSTGPDRVICGALDGSLFVSPPITLPARRQGRVTASACVGAHLVVAQGHEVHVITDPFREPVDLGVGAITAVDSVTGVMAVVAGCSGVAWYDVTSAVHDGRIELPTIVSVATDPLQRCVALGDLGGSVHVVQAGTEEAVELTGYPDRVALLDWLCSGTRLCVAADDELTLWQPDDSGLIHHDQPEQLVGHDATITALAASPCDELVATADVSGVVQVWAPTWVDLPVGSLRVNGIVLALAWRPDGRALAVSTSRGELALVEVVPAVAV